MSTENTLPGKRSIGIASPDETANQKKSTTPRMAVEERVKARIEEHMTDSLRAESPTQAVLEAMNNRSMAMNFWLDKAILARMQCAEPTIEEIEALKESMNMRLRLCREIQLTAQFARKIARRERDQDSGRAQVD